MKTLLTTILVALLSSLAAAQAPQMPAAGESQLRCDPGLKILAIDGKEERIGWTSDNAGGDCAIRLTPGRHLLRIGFEWNAGDFASGRDSWTSREERQVEFDAVPGRIHRLKDRFGQRNVDWVVDVTEEEANLPAHGDEYKALDKTAAREHRSSFLVARLPDPENVVVYLLHGRTQGIWFSGQKHELLYNRKREKLVVVEGGIGTTFSIGTAVINGNAFGHDKQRAYPCADSRLPAYENIPGGKVLYLGSFAYRAEPFGLVMQMSQDDIETARQLLREQEPELADRLEPAAYRLVRDASPCLAPGKVLLNATALP